MDKGCNSEWSFDVTFNAGLVVRCHRHYQHMGNHRATVEGNGEVRATIEWADA